MQIIISAILNVISLVPRRVFGMLQYSINRMNQWRNECGPRNLITTVELKSELINKCVSMDKVLKSGAWMHEESRVMHVTGIQFSGRKAPKCIPMLDLFHFLS